MDVFKEFAGDIVSKNILVSYIDDEDEQFIVNNIIKPLNNNGYKVIELKKDPRRIGELFYERLYDIAYGIFAAIVVFSPRMVDEKTKEQYKDCMKASFYEMGFYKAVCSTVYPLLLEGTDPSLHAELRHRYEKEWILKNLQCATDNEEDIKKLVNELVGKYSNYRNISYLGEDFISNRTIYERISTAKFTFIMRIKTETLMKVCNSIGDMDDAFDEPYLIELMRYLYGEIKVGALVIRFGETYGLEQAALEPYRSEGAILCKPVGKESSFSFDFGESDMDGIFVKIKAELYIPVHDVLGVAFKPYFHVDELAEKWDVNLLKILLEQDAIQSICTSKDNKKIYFLLPLTEMNLLDVDGVDIEEYGDRCNFVYPK